LKAPKFKLSSVNGFISVGLLRRWFSPFFFEANGLALFYYIYFDFDFIIWQAFVDDVLALFMLCLNK